MNDLIILFLFSNSAPCVRDNIIRIRISAAEQQEKPTKTYAFLFDPVEYIVDDFRGFIVFVWDDAVHGVLEEREHREPDSRPRRVALH